MRYITYRRSFGEILAAAVGAALVFALALAIVIVIVGIAAVLLPFVLIWLLWGY